MAKIENKLEMYLKESEPRINDRLAEAYAVKVKKILQTGDDKMQRAYEDMAMQIQQLQNKWEKAYTDKDWYENVYEFIIKDLEDDSYEFINLDTIENLMT